MDKYQKEQVEAEKAEGRHGHRTDAPAGPLAPNLTAAEHSRRRQRLYADVAAGKIAHPGKCPTCGRDAAISLEETVNTDSPVLRDARARGESLDPVFGESGYGKRSVTDPQGRVQNAE